ncbi:methionyl-tRNA formyltransferase [Sinorhizobium sp. NFACC03]|nr:methionyl-tRNA formyltransferase [Sinorhizobium sp. NFACC03]
MRFALVGAVEGSRIALEALVSANRPPGLVVTLPRDKASRHSDHADLSLVACRSGIDIIETADINDAATLRSLRHVDPDVILVVGWSQICGQAFRKVPRWGCLGFHPAALPRLRGRAVIPWTILVGEKTTGSTLFWLDEGTDSGPIVLQRLFDVAADETARSLYDKHTRNLAEMIVETVEALENGPVPGIPQDATQASYCAKRTPEDGLIDWSRCASDVERHVRALGEPYPGAFTYLRDQKIAIGKARLWYQTGRYIGLTAQVQAYTEAGFLVRCGDGQCLEVTEWTGKRPPVHSKFSVLPKGL